VSWLISAAQGAIPFRYWAGASPDAPAAHPFHSFWAAYFEAMSGLTTTGATVLADVESLPRSLLLWRAALHWFGGLGIVVLFVAVLPSLGVTGKRLFRSETTGPSKQGVRPQIRETARILWLIYCGITLLQIIALTLAGMGMFDAVCHTFATVATGGFSTRNASVAAFASPPMEIVFTVFMALSGLNFAMYDRLLRGQWRLVIRDPEVRLYVMLMLGAIAALTISLLLRNSSVEIVGGQREQLTVGSAMRHAAFTATSIQTTTGFSTADFDYWPFFAKAVLVFVMFVGGCAGSTASGFKVIRLWIIFKVLHREFEKVFRPHIVRPVRLAGAALDDETKLATVSYVLGYIMLFVLGSLAIMMFEQANASAHCDYTTAATASIATLSNVGPGLGLVGPSGNYGWFTTPSLLVMSLLMALGRLEIFAILALFMPRFWRGAS